MTPRFMTAKGAGLASGQSYYIGHVQQKNSGTSPKKTGNSTVLLRVLQDNKISGTTAIIAGCL